MFIDLHAKVPLVALLGEAGRGNQGSINDSALFEHQAPIDQLGVHGGKNLGIQVVGFK